jgi:hypothetical protein
MAGYFQVKHYRGRSGVRIVHLYLKRKISGDKLQKPG